MPLSIAGAALFLSAGLSRHEQAVPGYRWLFSLRHPAEAGIQLDAVLMGENDLAILFSYTRSYFRVNAPCPYELVRYLKKLMPLKRLIDLYTAIGFHRHGKDRVLPRFRVPSPHFGRPIQPGGGRAGNGDAGFHPAELRCGVQADQRSVRFSKRHNPRGSDPPVPPRFRARSRRTAGGGPRIRASPDCPGTIRTRIAGSPETRRCRNRSDSTATI